MKLVGREGWQVGGVQHGLGGRLNETESNRLRVEFVDVNHQKRQERPGLKAICIDLLTRTSIAAASFSRFVPLRGGPLGTRLSRGTPPVSGSLRFDAPQFAGHRCSAGTRCGWNFHE